MQLNRRALVLALTALLGATACSSGGGDTSPPGATQSVLAGNWFGTEEQTNGSLISLRVTVNNNNQITQILADGTSTGLTGAISAIPGRTNLFSINLSDGTEGGFFLDSSAQYVVFLDEEFNFGVLQKGANTLPNASMNAIFGRQYEGVTVLIDSSFTISEVLSSNVQVFGDGSFSGTDSAGTSFTSVSPLTQTSSLYGAWEAPYEASGSFGTEQGGVRVFTSPDRRFIGTWACPFSGTFPEDCSFSVWRAN